VITVTHEDEGGGKSPLVSVLFLYVTNFRRLFQQKRRTAGGKRNSRRPSNNSIIDAEGLT